MPCLPQAAAARLALGGLDADRPSRPSSEAPQEGVPGWRQPLAAVPEDWHSAPSFPRGPNPSGLIAFADVPGPPYPSRHALGRGGGSSGAERGGVSASSSSYTRGQLSWSTLALAVAVQGVGAAAGSHSSGQADAPEADQPTGSHRGDGEGRDGGGGSGGGNGGEGPTLVQRVLPEEGEAGQEGCSGRPVAEGAEGLEEPGPWRLRVCGRTGAGGRPSPALPRQPRPGEAQGGGHGGGRGGRQGRAGPVAEAVMATKASGGDIGKANFHINRTSDDGPGGDSLWGGAGEGKAGGAAGHRRGPPDGLHAPLDDEQEAAIRVRIAQMMSVGDKRSARCVADRESHQELLGVRPRPSSRGQRLRGFPFPGWEGLRARVGAGGRLVYEWFTSGSRMVPVRFPPGFADMGRMGQDPRA